MLLDELIVRLALDSKDIESKGGSATKKLDEIEKSGKGAEEGVKGLGTASRGTSGEIAGLTGKLGAFLALLGGTVALKDFIRDAVDTNTQLSFLSRNLGIGAQTIFAWSTASQELGGTAAGLQGTLKMLSQEGANLAFLGESRLIPFFSRMRIALPNPQDPNGPTTALRQMAEYAERAMKLGASRTTMHNWFAEFIPDEGTINLILQGTAALDAGQARAKKWAPTDAELRGAVAMKSALADLGAQFTKIGYDMLSAVTPNIEAFFGWLQKIGAWIQRNAGLATIFVEAAVATAALGAAIAAISSPILAVAAAFTAVASGILVAINDYETWKKGGISEFDWTDLAHRISLVGDAFEWVGDKIAYAWDWWGKWLDSHGIHLKDWAETALGDITGIHLAAPASTLGQAIAKQEGFGKPGAIPTLANNPGDIEWGEFARNHGATGSMVAAGGKQIAVFPDVATGMQALYTLLQQDYAGMSLQAAMAKYTGLGGVDLARYVAGVSKSVERTNGTAGLSDLLRYVSASAASFSKSHGAPMQGGKTIHIAQMNIHTQATDGKGIFESLKRGTDFLTFGAPANGASQ